MAGRLCMNTTEVKGITIPQGTTVQPDVWSLHYDPEYWGADPQQFDPDRLVSTSSKLAYITCQSKENQSNCIFILAIILE